MSARAELVEGPDLLHLEAVWDGGMRETYGFYRSLAPHQVALAAALVESALELQRLGGEAAAAPGLLLGDLCLARASRLLAEAGGRRLQVGFARVVEGAAAAAAGAGAPPPLRDQLVSLIGAAG